MTDSSAGPMALSRSKPTIVIVMAMEEEAAVVMDVLPFSDPPVLLEDGLPPLAWTTEVADLNLVLVVNGPDPVFEVASFGTDAATLSTYLSIKHFSPDLVLSVGVAGGFKSQGAEIGSVYVSTDSVRYFDRRVSISVPNYHDYAIGFYPVVDASNMIRSLGLFSGVVVTGGSFENSATDEEHIRNHGAAVIEMEAAAVAKMSMLMNTPFLAVKSVVNFEEDPAFANQFDTNFSTATRSLAGALEAIVFYLAEQGVSFPEHVK